MTWACRSCATGYGSISFGFGLSDRAEQAMTPGAIDLGLQQVVDGLSMYVSQAIIAPGVAVGEPVF